VGDPAIRPDAAMGHQACVDATSAPVSMGRLGAGTGATVGKTPASLPSDGGIGSALRTARSGLLVGAIAVVNAIGNVVDPVTGAVVAGARDPRTGDYVDVASALSSADPDETSRTNTTIGVVATNARLSPSEATRVAELAHDGLARAIRPAHTTRDGDTIFVLATGEVDADLDIVAIMAADSFAHAIVRAVVTDRPV
jgi:L-aminopeptidase/D-esterase-like protein